MTEHRVLIVDPDTQRAEARAYGLLQHGWRAQAAETIETARHHCETVGVEALVIAGIDSRALALLTSIRSGRLPKVNSDAAVITMPTTDETALRCYEAGATMALPPTSSIALLDAALSSATRHMKAHAHRVVEVGDVRVDYGQSMVTVNGAQLELSRKEFDIVSALADAGGNVMKRTDLANAVWGDPHMGTHSRALDQHISRVNRKAEAQGLPRPIANHGHGKGWKLKSDPHTR